MKTLFKVLSILLIIANALLVLLVVGLLVLSLVASASTSQGSTTSTLLLILSSAPTIVCAIIAFIAAKSGLTGDYHTCAKYGKFLFAVNIMAVITAISKNGNTATAIVQIAFSAIYFFLALKLDQE